MNEEGRLQVRVAASPVEGKANKELVRFLAQRLDIPPSYVTVVRGATSRHKVVDVQGLSEEEVRTKLTRPDNT